ncbi:MAG: sugar phosphate isomerase/epimerase family protein [Acidobacteriota bacterium]
MFVSMNGTVGKAPWPEFAHLAQRTGFGGVDVNVGRAMEEGLDSTRALLKELKLRSSALGLPVVLGKDDAAFRESLKKLEPVAHFARGIGSPRMVTWISSSSDTPKVELRKILKERLQVCAGVLARAGVRLGLEFLGPLHIRKRGAHEFIWRMDEMLEFARECGPNMGLLLDAWHWHHAGATPKDILAAGKRGIVHVHVADAPDLPPEKILDSERLLPGEGVIDWTGFFGALNKIGYEDAVSPEVMGRLKGKPPEEAAKLMLEATLGVMRKAGVA